jgi:hypothetical protein
LIFNIAEVDCTDKLVSLATSTLNNGISEEQNAVATIGCPLRELRPTKRSVSLGIGCLLTAQSEVLCVQNAGDDVISLPF